MSDTLLRAAFETRLNAWAAAQTPALPIFFENVTGSPTAPYARVDLLKGDTENQFLDGKHRQRVGVCQVSLILPPNSGTARASALADSLDAAFPVATPLVQGSLRVYLTRPFSASGGTPEANHYYVPVTCAYQAHTVLP